MLDYTISQVAAYLGAIERKQRRELVSQAIAMRMAQSVEGSTWARYMEGLERGRQK